MDQERLKWITSIIYSRLLFEYEGNRLKTGTSESGGAITQQQQEMDFL